MRVRDLLGALLCTVIVVAAAAPPLFAQEGMAREGSPDDAALIASALSAAPDEIAAKATVLDAGGDVLREGSNGFTCFPDDPDVPGNAPLCADAGWMKMIDAWLNGEDPPAVAAPAIVYALQGGWPASNVDPYAEGPTDDNEWIGPPGPHIAILLPGASPYAGLNTDPESGEAWVMWRDTPFAHLMIPAAPKR